MIKHLQLQGTYKEIGRIHGEQGKQEVINSLETYESLFKGYKQITWKEAGEIALTHLPAIEQYDSDLVEEMQGVAEGAGVDFEDILALNTRSEIALANYNSNTVKFSDGCTSIGTTPPLSDDTIVGQNWDWKASQIKSLLLLDIKQPGKPSIQMVTEGGIIGKIGFNTSGVGVGLNALLTNKKSEQVPIHLGLRAVMNSKSLTEAVSKIKGGQMASTANFLIGADQGNGESMVANYEVSPFGIDMLPAREGKVVHSNHIISDQIKQFVEDRNEFKFDDSLIRKERAEQLLYRHLYSGKKIDETSYKSWLSDLFNHPNSINHSENLNAPEHRRMETVFSIIMNLSQQTMDLCVGKADPNNFKHYSVKESFFTGV
ncbi:C45 family autoproteolytic acyltransferase/hydolase [Pontibacillus marinus]|uniref:Peptidase C45 hydrolase domain-containing protein n=1 Tax=Pontibacillus marinus BH030004 = DSM 16465 TaxID=1385511 RepID=A0A0A5GKY9_9BACI|nr:C45 family peptidase [Pontibacillus marinus]KGX91883.1 hypothetical protein N783_00560 [Pontibacillus marinus BH030004 = DSM 16465]